MSKQRLAFVGIVALLAAAVTEGADVATPLADAAQQQDRAAIRVLLDQGVDVNASQVDGMTALHWAVYHDDVEAVQQLVAVGANVKAENRYGVTSLSIGCQNGNGAIVNMLLAAGADPNAALRGGETPLMTASRTGKPGPVNALLAAGADVNAKERKGQTAIMWAAADGHVAVVAALIEAGADFRTPLKSGFTPLFFAVRNGRTEAALRLLSAGLDVNDVMHIQRPSGKGPTPGTSPLILAVENGHFALAMALIEAGANPNDLRCGFTPLHAITWVRKPIRGDGDPPPIGSGDLTSLDFVRKLIASGGDVNVRHGKRKAANGRLNHTGATPFLLASEAADLPLMRLLVELGADPLLTNADNCTPLLAAAGVGVLGSGDEAAGSEDEVIEAVGLLLKLGADINAVDENGNSAMHGAAYKSWPKLVRFVADHGADIDVWNQKNQRGWTPLLIAQGHRPGNFRPSPETMAAIEDVMVAAGINPPKPLPRKQRPR